MSKRPRPVASRRRRKPSFAARVRVYWILIALFIVAAGWGGWALATSPAFRVHAIEVRGLERVAREDVVARAAVDPAANIWLMNTGSVTRRIEAIPYVQVARVSRSLPGTISIDVAERAPEACARFRDGSSAVVDREFRILEAGCADATLPQYALHARSGARPGTFLHDDELTALQRDAVALKAAGQTYRRYERDAYGQLQVTMQDGIAVRFGEDEDLAKKERLIGPILAQLGPRAADVRTVDLRSPAAPVVEYRAPRPPKRPIHSF